MGIQSPGHSRSIHGVLTANGCATPEVHNHRSDLVFVGTELRAYLLLICGAVVFSVTVSTNREYTFTHMNGSTCMKTFNVSVHPRAIVIMLTETKVGCGTEFALVAMVFKLLPVGVLKQG